jgi:hypothetical protein
MFIQDHGDSSAELRQVINTQSITAIYENSQSGATLVDVIQTVPRSFHYRLDQRKNWFKVISRV